MAGNFFDKDGRVIDYYAIFNIPHDADTDEIKRAFRTLIKKYHPDTAMANGKNQTGKISAIIIGYRILSHEKTRKEYDEYLLKNLPVTDEHFFIVSQKRIKYSATLKDMLRARLLPRGMKRKDILYNFGQDIEIFLSVVESKKGAVACIELPAKTQCPLCAGGNPGCHVCRGIGRINTTSGIEVKIRPGTPSGTLIDVDLMAVKLDRFTTFRTKNVRIKITIVEDFS